VGDDAGYSVSEHFISADRWPAVARDFRRITKGLKKALRSHKFLCDHMCGRRGVIAVATNLQIDDELIVKAVKLGRHKTKKAAVTQALIEYVGSFQQQKVLSMFGTIDYDPKYDYKKQRARK